MAQKGHLEGEDFEQYWSHIRNHTGTTKGPTHLMGQLLMQIGIQADAKHHWEIEGKMKHISEIEDLKGEIREKPKNTAWKQLA